MPGTITVVNKHTHTGPATYIGRGSIFGNPYKLTPQEPRGATLERYTAYLRNTWRERGPLHTAVLDLARRHQAGEDLVLMCYCAPKPCHGDILKDAIQKVAATM